MKKIFKNKVVNIVLGMVVINIVLGIALATRTVLAQEECRETNVNIEFAKVVKLEYKHRECVNNEHQICGDDVTVEVDGQEYTVNHFREKTHKIDERICVALITQNGKTFAECMDCYGNELGETLRNTMTIEELEKKLNIKKD